MIKKDLDLHLFYEIVSGIISDNKDACIIFEKVKDDSATINIMKNKITKRSTNYFKISLMLLALGFFFSYVTVFYVNYKIAFMSFILYGFSFSILLYSIKIGKFKSFNLSFTTGELEYLNNLLKNKKIFTTEINSIITKKEDAIYVFEPEERLIRITINGYEPDKDYMIVKEHYFQIQVIDKNGIYINLEKEYCAVKN